MFHESILWCIIGPQTRSVETQYSSTEIESKKITQWMAKLSHQLTLNGF